MKWEKHGNSNAMGEFESVTVWVLREWEFITLVFSVTGERRISRRFPLRMSREDVMARAEKLLPETLKQLAMEHEARARRLREMMNEVER